MEFEQLLRLINQVSDSALDAFDYEEENLKIHMACKRKKLDAPAGAREILPAEPARSEGNIVKSPLVGTFYNAPSQGSEPFVKKGDTVKKGQVLAIIEAMKLMNEIESDCDGRIEEIYVKNGEAVDYGKPLFRII